EKIPKQTVATKTLGGDKQYFVNGKPLSYEWWKAFHSKKLNQLIEAALKANPDLRAADANLKTAQEVALSQRAAFYPRADLNLNGTRQETAHTLSSILANNGFYYNLYTPQLTISYVPDVFGYNRRLVESLNAQTATAIFQREAVYLTVTSNLVMAVIQEASLKEQIDTIHHLMVIGKEQLRLLKIEHEAGEIGLEGVAAQEAALAQIEANLPVLEKQLAQQYHLIAVLCGHFPSDEILANFRLKDLTLPQSLPLSLPSQLVSQRPDIRAAEEQLHAASAQIGVAVAQRLPSILLTATQGNAALNLNTLFTQTTNFWGLTANLAQPVFDAGLLLHRQKAAVATFKEALAQYRSVVLTAFQDVADTLKAIEYDAKALKATKLASDAAQKSLYIAKVQWKEGETGHLTVLNAEITYQNALLNLVQAQTNRYLDTTALFQALGGGWWNKCKDIPT
ncbi:MAG: efflux transporter outer membrane subunit, partial [Proteobacteria bacterium]|nr:efflux transporter outer membrane subunit [Pseudomonadota bacterium]